MKHLVVLIVLVFARLAAAQDEAVDRLTNELKSELPQARILAASRLGALGQRATPSIEAREAALADKNWKVRLFAGQALQEILPANQQAQFDELLALVEDFHDGESVTCQRSVDKILALGDDAEIAVPMFIATLGNPSWLKRRLAAQALGQIGAPAQAIPALVARLEDRHSEVRKEVIVGLGRCAAAKSKGGPLYPPAGERARRRKGEAKKRGEVQYSDSGNQKGLKSVTDLSA